MPVLFAEWLPEPVALLEFAVLGDAFNHRRSSHSRTLPQAWIPASSLPLNLFKTERVDVTLWHQTRFL